MSGRNNQTVFWFIDWFKVPAVYRSCLENQPPDSKNLEVHEIAQPPFIEIDPVLEVAAPIDRGKNWVSASSLSK